MHLLHYILIFDNIGNKNTMDHVRSGPMKKNINR